MYKIVDKKKERIVNHLKSRYGVSETFVDRYLFMFKAKSVFIVSKEKEAFVRKVMDNRSVVNIGIELFSNYKEFIPCSLGFCVIPYDEIKYNYVVINREYVVKYLRGEEMLLKDVIKHNVLSEGHVVCLYEKKVVGTCYCDKEKIRPNLAYVNKKAK